MKNVLTAALIGSSMMIAAPAFAQGVYVGPGGVGFDSGIHRDRDYYRDRDRDHYRGERSYEGRSVFRDGDRRDNRDRY